MSSHIYSELYENLKAYRGSINDVAERHTCSTQWVRQVLQGKYKDIDLVEIAAAVLAEYRQREDEVEKKVRESLED